MILRPVAFLLFVACFVAGCDESVSLNYSTRSEAEAESLFARGWLPEIIPPSNYDISMHNDLDLSISNGEFGFAESNHDAFVSQLERAPSRDEDGSLAYSYEDWFFSINADKNRCRFSMRLTLNRKPSEQDGAEQPAPESKREGEKKPKLESEGRSQ